MKSTITIKKSVYAIRIESWCNEPSIECPHMHHKAMTISRRCESVEVRYDERHGLQVNDSWLGHVDDPAKVMEDINQAVFSLMQW